MRAAGEALDEIADFAQTAVGAVRRYGFRRKTNVHPIDSIDESELAICGLGIAFIELGGLPTSEDKKSMQTSFRVVFKMSEQEADEVASLGHWFSQSCPSPMASFERIARRLKKLSGSSGIDEALPVFRHYASIAKSPISQQQTEALESLGRTFR